MGKSANWTPGDNFLRGEFPALFQRFSFTSVCISGKGSERKSPQQGTDSKTLIGMGFTIHV